MYPIRGSEREHITRLLNLAKDGPLCRVALWTSINPELVAVSYYVDSSLMERDSTQPFVEISQQQLRIEETLPQVIGKSNQFLPDGRSQEFPFNSPNLSSVSGTVNKALINAIEVPGTNVQKNINDSQNEPQLEGECIDIASEDDDDCVIEIETNIRNNEKSFNLTHNSDKNDKSNSDREKQLKIRPMSELTEPGITTDNGVVINREKNSGPLTSNHISSEVTSKNSSPVQGTNAVSKHTINENRSSAHSKISKVCNASETNCDNDITMDVIDIDSDDESTNIYSSPNHFSVSDANKITTEDTQNKGRTASSTQMTPNMSSLSMSKTLNSPHQTMHCIEKISTGKSSSFLSPNLNSTNVTKRKFITTPKRRFDQQPLRQNQYELAAATKVLDFECTTQSESSALNSKIEIEEVSIDGIVSTRDPKATFIPSNNSISQDNSLQMYNPVWANSSSPNRSICPSGEVENVIDISSDDESRV